MTGEEISIPKFCLMFRTQDMSNVLSIERPSSSQFELLKFWVGFCKAYELDSTT